MRRLTPRRESRKSVAVILEKVPPPTPADVEQFIGSAASAAAQVGRAIAEPMSAARQPTREALAAEIMATLIAKYRKHDAKEGFRALGGSPSVAELAREAVAAADALFAELGRTDAEYLDDEETHS